MTLQNLHFATGNENKLREAREILGISVEQFKIDLDEIQSVSVEEVVVHKARQAYEIAGKPVLIEDTGLEILAWNGLPGALIKWFDTSVGNDGIIQMLSGFTDRSAKATSCFAYFDGSTLHKGIGSIDGSIAIEPTGTNGFGWDPIFIPSGSAKTFAQMSPEEKNSLSMRALALKDLINSQK